MQTLDGGLCSELRRKPVHCICSRVHPLCGDDEHAGVKIDALPNKMTHPGIARTRAQQLDRTDRLLAPLVGWIA